MFKYCASIILLLKHIFFRFYIICLANIIWLMIYYCALHNIVLLRLIRYKSLPIDLDRLQKMNEIFRMSLVYVFWKIASGLLRIDVEMI